MKTELLTDVTVEEICKGFQYSELEGKGVEDEMCGLDWGRLYEPYHANAYDPDAVWARVKALYADESGYNYGYTLTTPNGATLTRTVTRDPYRRSLTLDCTTRFNNVEVASFVYTFDANSRPVTRNDDRFAYNDRDEIIGATIGTNHIEHAYDTIGNHVFCAYNAATNFYANNALNQTVAQYSIVSHGGTEPQSGEGVQGEEFAFTTNKFTWSAQGGLQRGGRFIYTFDAEDQLVSVTSSTLSNGAIRVVNAYDDFGRTLSATGPLASTFPFLFSTKYFDCKIDLYYYVHRFYSPLLRKWFSQDPVYENGGINLYAICLNNCLVDSDMLGLSIVEYVTEGGNAVKKPEDVHVSTKAMNHPAIPSYIISWGEFVGEVRSIHNCKVYVGLF